MTDPGRQLPAALQKVERRCSRYCMRLAGRALWRAAASAADSGRIVVIASRPKAVPMSAGSSSTLRAVRREVDRKRRARAIRFMVLALEVCKQYRRLRANQHPRNAGRSGRIWRPEPNPSQLRHGYSATYLLPFAL